MHVGCIFNRIKGGFCGNIGMYKDIVKTFVHSVPLERVDNVEILKTNKKRHFFSKRTSLSSFYQK